MSAQPFFLALTIHIVMAPKTPKTFQFTLPCEVVRLERTDKKMKQRLLQNNEGHNNHFLSWSIQKITGLEILILFINTHRPAEAF